MVFPLFILYYINTKKSVHFGHFWQKIFLFLHFFSEILKRLNISSSSSVVLEIGDTWEEGTLFAVQAQEIEEISLEAFQAINDKNLYRDFDFILPFRN